MLCNSSKVFSVLCRSSTSNPRFAFKKFHNEAASAVESTLRVWFESLHAFHIVVYIFCFSQFFAAHSIDRYLYLFCSELCCQMCWIFSILFSFPNSLTLIFPFNSLLPSPIRFHCSLFSTIRCLLHYTCLFYVIVWCPKKVSFFYLFVPSVLERYSLLHKSLLRSHAELLHIFQLKAHHQQLIPIISAYSWIFPSLFVHVSNSNPVK